MKFLVINGVNLNLTGKREKSVYGTETLEEINAAVKKASEGELKFYIISTEDITDEQIVLTVVFNVKHACEDKTAELEISGSGLTDSLTNAIMLNFVDTSITIPPHHTEATAVVENRVEPTCTAEGSYDNVVYCTACGIEISREKIVVNVLGHDKVSHEAKTPTCTIYGWNAYDTCTRCDYTTYEEIPALGHDRVQHSAQSATCTSLGWNAYETCSRCDYSTYAEIPALGHNKTQHSAKDATCTEIGWNAYETCSRCDYSTYAEIPALGHNKTQHSAKDATCTEIGWNAYETCSRCNYSTYSEIPALGHNYTSVETIDAMVYTCQNCGYSYSEVIDRQPVYLSNTDFVPLGDLISPPR